MVDQKMNKIMSLYRENTEPAKPILLMAVALLLIYFIPAGH